MDYLFWRKNNIIKPKQDMNPYPWIIWYIQKARNDKLFRGIDRDLLELVRYAESECQVWFDTNEVVQPVVQVNNTEESQVVSLGNICLLDGSQTASAQMWMDLVGQWWEHSTYGEKKFHSTRISFAFGSRSNAVGNGEYAPTFNMPKLLDVM